MPSTKNLDEDDWFKIVNVSICVLTLVTAIIFMVMSGVMKSDYENNTKRYKYLDKWYAFLIVGVCILGLWSMTYGIYIMSEIFGYLVSKR